MQSRKAQPGFTLVELLTVIAIIGILVALLMPAVQSAREASRRIHCSNHLKQFGVAISAYAATHGVLPSGTAYDRPLDDLSVPAYGRTGKGWIICILPHLEQQSLYDQFVPGFEAGEMIRGGGIQIPECRKAMQTEIPMIRCPSDPQARELSDQQWQWVGIPVVLTNYKGVAGDPRIQNGASIHQGTQPDCHGLRNCTGLFWRHTYLNPIAPASISDGLGNTFAIGEDVPEHNHHSAAYYGNGDWSSCSAPLNYFPNPPTPDAFWNVQSFRSRHPGGAYFAMADGAVRFISEAIDYSLYRALSTRAGGEVAEVP